jgi:hypothetical protein
MICRWGIIKSKPLKTCHFRKEVKCDENDGMSQKGKCDENDGPEGVPYITTFLEIYTKSENR